MANMNSDGTPKLFQLLTGQQAADILPTQEFVRMRVSLAVMDPAYTRTQNQDALYLVEAPKTPPTPSPRNPRCAQRQQPSPGSAYSGPRDSEAMFSDGSLSEESSASSPNGDGRTRMSCVTMRQLIAKDTGLKVENVAKILKAFSNIALLQLRERKQFKIPKMALLRVGTRKNKPIVRTRMMPKFQKAVEDPNVNFAPQWHPPEMRDARLARQRLTRKRLRPWTSAYAPPARSAPAPRLAVPVAPLAAHPSGSAPVRPPAPAAPRAASPLRPAPVELAAPVAPLAAHSSGSAPLAPLAPAAIHLLRVPLA